MGCDIHLYIEHKNSKGEWEEFKVDKRLLPDDRNYILFAFLANVRNYSSSIVEPQFANRGIPEDTSMSREETEDFFMGDHSFTYAYLNEIYEAPWEEFELQECYFRIFCKYIIPRISNLCGMLSSEEKKNIRIIMGFDN